MNGDYTIYKKTANNEELRIDIGFEYHIENDGIGPYEYWGCQGYEHGTDYMEIDEITSAYVVREGLVAKKKEDIPNIKGICEIRQNEDGTYTYSHHREINPNTLDIDEVDEEVCDNYDWRSDYDDEM